MTVVMVTGAGADSRRTAAQSVEQVFNANQLSTSTNSECSRSAELCTWTLPSCRVRHNALQSAATPTASRQPVLGLAAASESVGHDGITASWLCRLSAGLCHCTALPFTVWILTDDGPDVSTTISSRQTSAATSQQ